MFFSEFISNLLFCHLVLYRVIELWTTGSPAAFLCYISNNFMFPSYASDPVRGGTLVNLASRYQEQLMVSKGMWWLYKKLAEGLGEIVKGIHAPELTVSRQNLKIQHTFKITASILKVSSTTFIHILSSNVSGSNIPLYVTLPSPSSPSSRRLPTSLFTKIWHLFLQRSIAAAEKKIIKFILYISWNLFLLYYALWIIIIMLYCSRTCPLLGASIVT